MAVPPALPAPRRVLLRGGGVYTRPGSAPPRCSSSTVGSRGSARTRQPTYTSTSADTVVELRRPAGHARLRRRPRTPGLDRVRACSRSTSARRVSRRRGPEPAGSASRRVTPRRVLFAYGWDESRWPEGRPFTAAELDRAVGGRVAYVAAGRLPLGRRLVRAARRTTPASPPATAGGATAWSRATPTTPPGRSPMRSGRPTTASARSGTALAACREPGRHVGARAQRPPHRPVRRLRDAARDRGRARRCPRSCPTGARSSAVRARRWPARGAAGFAGDLCVDGAVGSRTACHARAVRRRPRPAAISTSTATRSPSTSSSAPSAASRPASTSSVTGRWPRPSPASRRPPTSSAPTRSCRPGTGSSTSRCRPPRRSRRSPSSASWPACSRPSTPRGAAPASSTSDGSASPAPGR